MVEIDSVILEMFKIYVERYGWTREQADKQTIN